ncbi:MAG: hypothetical protein ABL883_02520 [Terricaulis sp.]
MARTRKSANLASDGMAWLQVMPFPALNPLNWWAMTSPKNSMLASLKGAQATLQAWRSSSDSLRAMMRAQQDALLAMCVTPTASEDEASSEADAAAENAPRTEAADFVTPMLDVTRAYGRVGKAFIIAQRDTMRAFTQTEKPH